MNKDFENYIGTPSEWLQYKEDEGEWSRFQKSVEQGTKPDKQPGLTGLHRNTLDGAFWFYFDKKNKKWYFGGETLD